MREVECKFIPEKNSSGKRKVKRAEEERREVKRNWLRKKGKIKIKEETREGGRKEVKDKDLRKKRKMKKRENKERMKE